MWRLTVVGALFFLPSLQASVLYDYSDFRSNRVLFTTGQILTSPTFVPSSSFLYSTGPFTINSFAIDPTVATFTLQLSVGTDGNQCQEPTLAAGSYNCYGLFFLDIVPFTSFRYEYSDYWGRELSFTTAELLVDETTITSFDTLSGPPSLVNGLQFTLNPQTGLLVLDTPGTQDNLTGAIPDFLKTGEYSHPLVTLRITALNEVPEPAPALLTGLGVLGLGWLRRRRAR